MSDASSAWRPVVSVVVPMLDEHGFIDACLDGFAAQTWPSELLDVIVVDGGSTDGSRQLVDTRTEQDPWLRVVDNPNRKAAAAFNVGVERAKGTVVVLFSAHGVPAPDFVGRSVAVLAESGAVGVGGACAHQGVDATSRAIGLAMTSAFGMASPVRYGSTRRDVDTIIHPAYRRDALVSVGPFDESLERNSDYELNWRLRDAGGRLVFDPAISSVYRPRATLGTLTRQFWMYGRWKARVVIRHPRSLRPRHAVPPVAVAGIGLAPLLLRGRVTRRLAIVAASCYVALDAVATVQARPVANDADPLVLAVAFPVMHVAWGAGFLVSIAGWLGRATRG